MIFMPGMNTLIWLKFGYKRAAGGEVCHLESRLRMRFTPSFLG